MIFMTISLFKMKIIYIHEEITDTQIQNFGKYIQCFVLYTFEYLVLKHFFFRKLATKNERKRVKNQ